MDKSCDNCYWTPYNKYCWCAYQANKPTEGICENHNYICIECDSNRAEYKKQNKYYCTDCLLKEYNVEECTTYYSDGEYLGSEDDLDEVIKTLDCDIEEV